MYKPLPKELTVKQSSINGLGLFTMIDLNKGHEFGISHIKDNRFENDYIRTPLGGFFNHSDNPNCEAYIDGDYIRLKTIQSIKSGEELTVKYWLYKLK
jgi:SET domain-containing protein